MKILISILTTLVTTIIAFAGNNNNLKSQLESGINYYNAEYGLIAVYSEDSYLTDKHYGIWMFANDSFIEDTITPPYPNFYTDSFLLIDDTIRGIFETESGFIISENNIGVISSTHLTLIKDDIRITFDKVKYPYPSRGISLYYTDTSETAVLIENTKFLERNSRFLGTYTSVTNNILKIELDTVKYENFGISMLFRITSTINNQTTVYTNCMYDKKMNIRTENYIPEKRITVMNVLGKLYKHSNKLVFANSTYKKIKN